MPDWQLGLNHFRASMMAQGNRDRNRPARPTPQGALAKGWSAPVLARRLGSSRSEGAARTSRPLRSACKLRAGAWPWRGAKHRLVGPEDHSWGVSLRGKGITCLWESRHLQVQERNRGIPSRSQTFPSHPCLATPAVLRSGFVCSLLRSPPTFSCRAPTAGNFDLQHFLKIV
jgi:hypothetical protein